MNRFKLLLILCCMSAGVFSQSYGNEWINTDQVYYSFSLNKSGIYRITYADLKNSGIPVDLIQPKNFQLFTKGKQVRLWVQGEGDNKFDAGDYIEFYGTYNDGTTDSALYRKSSEQPHTYMSLYQDSLPYYLTWSLTQPGLRYALNSDVNFSGLSPDSFFTHTEYLFFKDQHFDGSPYANLGFYSEYTEGEGYMSKNVAGNNHLVFTLNTPAAISTGPKPRLTVLAFGKSDPSSATDFDPDGNNHEFELSIGTVGSHKILFAKRHRGYSSLFFDTIVEYSDISAATRVNCRSSFGAKGRHAVSFIKLQYSRKFDMLNVSSLSFQSGTNPYIKFVNYPLSRQSPVILDLDNGYRYAYDLQSGLLQFKTKGPGTVVISDSVDIQVISQFKRVLFGSLPLASQNYDYLIISHSSMRTSAQEYKSYRESTAGGNHKVALLFADELYHLFYYGIHHPLALRNAYKYYQESNSNIRHILLLGKGQVYNRVTFSPVNRNQLDLVPTAGLPASDFLVFADYDMLKRGDTVAIGRVPATSNDQVLAYLQKVKSFESDYNTRLTKKVVQVSGGLDITESQSFVSYLDEFYEIFRTSKVGGDRDLFSKETSTSTDESLADLINASINEGCVMIDYFGHAAKDLLEVSFGSPADIKPSSGFPIFAFNGCVVGSSYEEKSLVENFILEPQNGAITWIGQTTYGITSELSRFSKVLRQNLFDNQYGSTNGFVFTTSLFQHNNIANNYSNSLFHQTSFHGDPGIQQFIQNKPDFTFDIAKPILTEPIGISEYYSLSGTILNKGMIAEDSFDLRVEIYNSENKLIFLKDSLFKDSHKILFSVETNISYRLGGAYTIRITIDPGNKIEEFGTLGESNNIFSSTYLLYSNLPEILYPQQDRIVSESGFNMIFHNNAFGQNRDFVIQLDSSPFFNSSLFMEKLMTTDQEIAQVTISLPPIDSIDYYLRIRPAGTQDWKTVTFPFIYKSNAGWSQGNTHKFGKYEMENIQLNSEGQLAFTRFATSNYSLHINGRFSSGWGHIRYAGLVTYTLGFTLQGVRLMLVNPDNNQRYTVSNSRQLISSGNYLSWGIPSNYPEIKYYLQGAPSGVYVFNTTIPSERDSLISFLDSVPYGYHLFLISGPETGIAQWEDKLFNALELFGSNKIKLIKDEFPFGLIGKKGLKPGDAIEALPNFDNQVFSPAEQTLVAQGPVYPINSEGNIQTLPIGRSNSWESLYLHLTELEPEDFYEVTLVGIDSLGEETVLIVDSLKNYFDLKPFSAQEYPQVKIQIKFSDQVHRTIPNLRRIILSHGILADGIVLNSISGRQIARDTFYQGDSLIMKAAFYNYSSNPILDFSSDVFIKNDDSLFTQTDTFHHMNLMPGDTLIIYKKIRTENLKFNQKFIAQFNQSRKSEELNFDNNYFQGGFFVQPDVREPVAKILVNGRALFNNELISGKSDFLFLFKDDNPNVEFKKEDITVKLQKKGDTLLTLDVNQPEFGEISRSTESDWSQLNYSPETLKDGTYTLFLEIKDPISKKLDVESVQFQIKSEKTITNIYPYPNPTTGKTQFVFTLTGDRPPSDILVRIYSISGKMIREINLNETGDLSIGNNISSVYWDGKDSDGDQVGNGVYLYDVKILDSEIYRKSSLEETNGMFDHGMGKIYLMR